MSLPLDSCTTISIIGATGTGKTSWVFKLLRHKDIMFKDPPTHIMYCYAIHQPMFDQMEASIPNFTLHEGLPSQATLEEFCDGQHRLILLDDLMSDVVSNCEMGKLFTQGAHHRRITVIFISQNLYAKGKSAKTIALNTHVLVLFKSMRSTGQIAYMGRELFPGHQRVLLDAYLDATSKRYGYLLIDMSPHAEFEEYRMRTQIFPDEEPLIIYVPRV